MFRQSSETDIEALPARLQQPTLTRQSISFSSLPKRSDAAEDTESSRTAGSHYEKPACPPKSPYPWQEKGYPALATAMSQEPSVLVFRRFGRLNALNLLALQAELQGLEREYQEQLRADDTAPADDDARTLSTDMWKLATAEGPLARQRRILDRIRPKLEQYNAALAASAAVDRLPAPLPGDVDNLCAWLDSPEGGDGFMARGGRGEGGSGGGGGGGYFHGNGGHGADAVPEPHTYDEIWRDDFVSLKPDAAGEAKLVKVLNPVLLRWYHKHIEWRLYPNRKRFRDGRGGSYEFHKAYMNKRDDFFDAVSTVTSIAATLTASLMPIVAVLILYFIKNVLYRIGVSIAMTAVFGLVLATCTNSSLKEIFSATIAFAGLEVIFIGTNGVS